MTEAKHTPGPWSYENESQTVYVGDQIEGRWIAQVRGWGWLQKLKNGEEVQDANGRLIAAAPELLDALRVVAAALAWQCHGDCRAFGDDPILPTQEAIEKATAAIAKATGN